MVFLIHDGTNETATFLVSHHLNVLRVHCINDFLKIDLSSAQRHHLYTDSLVVDNVKGMEHNLADFFLTGNSFIPLTVKGTGNILERTVRNEHLTINDSSTQLWNRNVSDMGYGVRVLTEPSSLLTDSSAEDSYKVREEVKCSSCAVKLLFDVVVSRVKAFVLRLFIFKLFCQHWGDILHIGINVVLSTGILSKQCFYFHSYLLFQGLKLWILSRRVLGSPSKQIALSSM